MLYWLKYVIVPLICFFLSPTLPSGKLNRWHWHNNLSIICWHYCIDIDSDTDIEIETSRNSKTNPWNLLSKWKRFLFATARSCRQAPETWRRLPRRKRRRLGWCQSVSWNITKDLVHQELKDTLICLSVQVQVPGLWSFVQWYCSSLCLELRESA